MSGFYVRLSPALRTLIGEAGPVSDGARALLLLGAAAAGLDIEQAEGDAGVLLAAPLDRRVKAALRAAFFGSTGDSATAILGDSFSDSATAIALPSNDDPFAGVGFEV